MIFVGLDLSLNATGFCLYDSEADKAETGRLDKLVDKARGVQRIQRQYEWFCSLYGPCGRAGGIQPACTAVEGYSYGSKGNSSYQIGELGGVVRLCLYSLKVPLVEFSPSSLKLFATGKGNASKEEVAHSASQIYGIAFPNSDECDAFILSQMAHAYFTEAKQRRPWRAKALASGKRLV